MAKNVQYPFAYTLPYVCVGIEGAHRGKEYYCIGCDGPMIPRSLSSDKVQAHFAHKAEPCPRDNALHRTAQAIICESFLGALRDEREYLALYPCPQCEGPTEPVNLAMQGSSIAIEKTVVEGTQSDIVIFKPDGQPRVIIEVVVSSDFEKKETTNIRYQNSGIPILKVHPDWETISILGEKLTGERLVNAKATPLCGICRERERQHREYLRLHKLFREQAQELAARIKPLPTTESRLRPITHDRFGSPLKKRTRDAVMHNAKLLVELGFVQQSKRPTLFLRREDRWKIYADLDSTDVMRIWEVDCNAALYAFPEASPGRECLLKAVGENLSAYGVGVRRHFPDASCSLCEDGG